MDEVSSLRMPSDLLIPQKILRDPETKQPWQVPASFSALDLQAANCELHEPEPKTIDTVTKAGVEADPEAARKALRTPVKRGHRNEGELWSYILGTQDAVAWRTSQEKPKQNIKEAPNYWREQLSESFLRGLRLREDSITLTLNLIQGRVMRLLERLGHCESPHLTPWSFLETAGTFNRNKDQQGRMPNVSCLIWLGSSREASTPNISCPSFPHVVEQLGLRIGKQVDGYHYHVLQANDAKVTPAFDMSKLLNRSQVQWLREASPAYNEAAVAVLPETTPVEALIWVWRLVIYVGNQGIEVKSQ